jgi:WD40 repeat protein/tetratricopeptide (TPR) repeat protein
MHAPPSDRFNPFPGLRPFQIEEEYLFFGRETQRKELIALLREHRFVAVLGASGSGKSSLVRAGLLPALFGGIMTRAGSHWHTAILRPGGSPVHNLGAALLDTELWADALRPTPLDLETTLWRSGLGLVEAVRQARLPHNENLLVVVDQFEELFRFGQSQAERSTRDEAAAFVNLLLEAARQEDASIYVVLTMRSDFFGDCSQFEDLAEAINKGEYLVPRLTRDQKKQAIEGPIKVGGASIAPRLVQRLLGDVGDDPDQLPIMQHALMRTWEHWTTDHAQDEPLDLRHYEGIGGMREALSRHADEVFAELPDDRHRVVAERVFKALTERGADNRGIRRPTRVSQLAAITGAADAEVRSVVEVFRKSGRTFLMPPEGVELSSDTVIDISHESLMRVWQRLRHWVEEEAQSARIYSRLAETAALYAEGKAGLYHDPDLQIALSWRETAEPNEAWAGRYHPAFASAIAFLEKSAATKQAEEAAREAARQRELDQAKALAQAEHRRAEEQIRFAARLKWLVRGLGLVAMIALTAFGAALVARWEARRQAQLAESSRAAAQRSAERATEQARIAAEQRGVADRMSHQSKELADTLKSTLTRADFIAGSEQLEAGKVGRGLSFLARSMRTDPTFTPAAALTLQALSEHTLALEPPVMLRQDKPIENWFINSTKDVGASIDLEGHGLLWDLTAGRRIAPLADGRQLAGVQFTKDGNLAFAVIPTDGEIRGWEAHTGKAATAAIKPGYGFQEFQLGAPTGATLILAVQNGDGSLQLWDALKAEPIGSKLKTEGKVARFGFSPDGRWVFGDFDDRQLGLWNATTAEALLPPTHHGLVVTEARVSPSSRFVALGSLPAKEVLWWDVSNPSAPPRRAALDQPVRALRFNRAGDRLVAVGWEEARESATLQVKVFSLPGGQETARIDEPKISVPPGLTWPVSGAIADGQGFWIAAALLDHRTLKVWDLESGKTISQLPEQDSPFEFLNYSPEGGRVAVTLKKKEIRVWDLFTGKPIGEPIEFKASPEGMYFSPDGETFFLTLQEGGVMVHGYDARSGKLLAEPFLISRMMNPIIADTTNRARQVSFCTEFVNSGDRRSVQTGGEISIWRSEPGQALVPSLAVPGSLPHAEFSPDGQRFVAVNFGPNPNGDPSYAFIWDTQTRQLLFKLHHPAGLNYASFSPDSRRLVTADFRHVARIWNLDNQELPLKLVHDQGVRLAKFSADGKLVLTTTDNGKVQVWDSHKGLPMFEPIKVAERIHGAQFSPDGSQFVVAGLEPRFKVFDSHTGKEAFPPLQTRRQAQEIAHSPDGAVLFGITFGGEAAAWDAKTGSLLREMPSPGWFQSMAFHPGGQLVATASGGRDEDDGIVQLWNWKEGRLVAQPMAIPGRPLRSCFSRDGSRVGALSSTGALRVWESSTGRTLISRPPKDNLGLGLAFSADGRHLLVSYLRPGEIEVFDLPAPAEQTPDWLPALAEATAGTRLNDQGALEAVVSDKLEALRQSLVQTPTGDASAGWANWFFADRQTRPISPAEKFTVPEYALRLTTDPGPLTNRLRALRLAPNDGRVYARLAFEMASSTNRSSLLPHATNHWNDTVQWYVDQATNVAPDSAEVWAVRAGTLVLLGREALAKDSAERALALDAQSPNGWYATALTLAADGQHEEAYKSFAQSFALLPKKTNELDWQNQKLKPYLMGALGEWMEVQDQNPVELARLGQRRLDDSSRLTDLKYWEARWCTKRATEFLPENPEAWLLYAQSLMAPGEEDQSLASLQNAVDLDDSGKPYQRQYGAWVRARIELLDRAGRYDESRAFALRRGIPPRSGGATSPQLDLSQYYNASLWEDVHRTKGGRSSDVHWWEDLPKGLTNLAGIQFDLRGEIQLNGSALAQGRNSSSGAYAVSYPQEIKGVSVKSKAQWLHFLQSSGWGGTVRPGTRIAHYTLHYADGQTHEIPMVIGVNVSEWLNNPFAVPRLAQLGWIEHSGDNYKTLYISSWENPRPNVEITEMDLVSDMTTAAPMVFAITLENPKEEAQLDTCSPGALAQEALSKVKRVQGLNDPGKAYANKLTSLALVKAPEDPTVKHLRAEVLIRSGKLAEAKPVVDALLATNAKDHAAWYLKALWLAKSQARDDCLAAIRNAVKLLTPVEDPRGERRREYVQTAVDLLEAEGKVGEARQFQVRANVPPRDTAAGPQQIDLDPHYNATFNEAWYQRHDENEFAAALRTFPGGLATLQGVVFDARAVIQLNDRNRRFVHEFPNEISGIKVGLRGQLIHFLHSCSLNERFGNTIARYRIHYADGQTKEFPVAFGQDLDDLYLDRFANPIANLAWRAPNVTEDNRDAALYLSTWENPTPEVEISAIDFVSELSEAQPFLLAVTVEPFMADADLDKLPARKLAELAVNKVNPAAHPSAQTITYARRLSQKAVESAGADAEVWRLHAEMLARLGQPGDSLQAVEKSLALDSENPDAWRLKEQLLKALSRYSDAQPAAAERRRTELRAKIPPRDTSAGANLVDLSAYYNVATAEPLHPLAGFSAAGAENYSRLPTGLQRFAGVEFDVRGIIHLQSANSEANALQREYPHAVTGIRIAQRAHKLHFLHGLGWVRSDPAGTPVAKYVIHFANGEQREVPFLLVEDAYDWHLSATRRNQPTGPQSKIAWRGPGGLGQDRELGLYMKTWENPLPDVEITHIDFISAMAEATPFLVALTLE